MRETRVVVGSGAGGRISWCPLERVGVAQAGALAASGEAAAARGGGRRQSGGGFGDGGGGQIGARYEGRGEGQMRERVNATEMTEAVSRAGGIDGECECN